MTEYENAIEINNLSKKYEEYVLNKVSFSVPKGSVMGYIGQNGAGKTTTIRSMMNLIPIDEGEIKILGMDYRKSETDIKKRIAVVFDELPVQDIFDAKDLSYIFEDLYEECTLKIQYLAVIRLSMFSFMQLAVAFSALLEVHL